MSEAAIDHTYFWTGRGCPEEDCEGDLQQQDWMNVMCLSCERVWMHSRDSETHKLRTQTFDTVAEEPILATDGGVDQDDGAIEQDRCIGCGSTGADVELRRVPYDYGVSREYVCDDCEEGAR